MTLMAQQLAPVFSVRPFETLERFLNRYSSATTGDIRCWPNCVVFQCPM